MIAVKENYDKVFAKYPSLSHYSLNRSLKEMKIFLEKYREVCGNPFPVAKMLDEYCTNDVWILANGLFKQRDRLKSITKGIDILRYENFFNFKKNLKFF